MEITLFFFYQIVLNFPLIPVIEWRSAEHLHDHAVPGCSLLTRISVNSDMDK